MPWCSLPKSACLLFILAYLLSNFHRYFFVFCQIFLLILCLLRISSGKSLSSDGFLSLKLYLLPDFLRYSFVFCQISFVTFSFCQASFVKTVSSVSSPSLKLYLLSDFFRYFLSGLCKFRNPGYSDIDFRDFIPRSEIYFAGYRKSEHRLKLFYCLLRSWAINAVRCNGR